MLVYYENSDRTRKIIFDGDEYGIADMDLFQHEFKYDSENDKITKLSTGIVTHKIEANITGNGKKNWQQLYDEMNGIFLRDAILNKPGILNVNNSYMPCYFYATTPTEIFEDWGFQTVELKIVTDRAVWIEEQTIKISSISATTDTSEETKERNNPYSYPYTYPLLQTRINLSIDHYTDSDFQMKIYGPTLSVNIGIAGHSYIVNYSIEASEYMVIDSRSYIPKEERLYIVRANGEKENIFNYRSPEYSVFKKIPAGNITIDYPRTYGVDLTIFKERSEPLWSLSR